jgi:sugar-phosphatase
VLLDMDGVLVDSTATVEDHWSRWANRRGLPPSDVLRFAHGSPISEVVARFVDPDEVSDESDWVEGLSSEATIDQAMPGALAILTQRLMPIAVVSSATRQVVEARLKRADLPIPTVLVGADDVPHGKPDPASYLLAASRLGVNINECVGVEDTPVGLRALLASGAAPLAVLTTHAADELAGARALLDDLGQLQVGIGSVSWPRT